MADAITKEQIKNDEKREERRDRLQEPAEHDTPTPAERAAATAFARQANRERRRAARREHAAVATYGVPAARAWAHGERAARDAARVRRSAAVAHEIGHGAL